jgi:hypothetical protein
MSNWQAAEDVVVLLSHMTERERTVLADELGDSPLRSNLIDQLIPRLIHVETPREAGIYLRILHCLQPRLQEWILQEQDPVLDALLASRIPAVVNATIRALSEFEAISWWLL